MGVRILLLGVGCWLSAVSAQWLEATVPLPDSLGRYVNVTSIAFSPVLRRAYVGTYQGLIGVVAADRRQKLDWVQLPGRIVKLERNAAGDRIYAITNWSDSLFVMDATTDSIVARLGGGEKPRALCFDSVHNKVFCAESASSTVRVADGTSGNLIAVIPVPAGPMAICFDPAQGKVYCACTRAAAIAVIDASRDSVRKIIPAYYNVSGICLNPARGRVYIGCYGTVLVLDTGLDSLVAYVSCASPLRTICYDPLDDRVYCAAYPGVVQAIDCGQNVVIATVNISSEPMCLSYSLANDRLYCGMVSHGVAVIACATNRLVTTLELAPNATTAVADPDSATVWIGTGDGYDLTVADAWGDSILGAVQLGCAASELCYNPGLSKLYVACYGGTTSWVTVIDAATNRILRHVPTGRYSTAIGYSPGADAVCVYSKYENRLKMIDCRTDTVRAVIPVRGGLDGLLCMGSDNARAYCSSTTDFALTVVNCLAESVVREYGLMVYPYEMCYEAVHKRLYAKCYHPPPNPNPDTILVVDGSTDEIIAGISTQLVAGGPMCYNPINELLYAADAMNGVMALVDWRTNQVTRYLYIGSLGDLCCDTRDNKVYVGCRTGHVVWVIDGVTQRDSVINVGGLFIGDVFYNPLSNNVFVAADDIVVIDAAAQNIRTRIPAAMSYEYNDNAFALDSARQQVYALSRHQSRVLVIRDTAVSGSAENPTRQATERRGPTIVRNVLQLPLTFGFERRPPSVLLDISGRKVLDLHPGPNDVSRLAPGVYFVRSEPSAVGRQPFAVRKVVIQR